MGEGSKGEHNSEINYFINKTIFVMEKIKLIEDDIELWFAEGIILNREQLNRLLTKEDKKSIKYVKKSNKRYIADRKRLEEEGNVRENYRYYSDYLKALIEALGDISEDENRNEFFKKQPHDFMKVIEDRVQEAL